ncbi:DUF3046 domain-containing protein [Cryobacterium sp. CG_9.6]|uniref:DUF3046 domain-containing protein n=1 Tax=Cryobacterium sp. CG_9.6 TaxID=2760710 RepID=UPI0024767FAC|nr:DUF3046 domain-containing protein [Cryobacterium sp. CG_9.6]MDH6236615.1 hypothetical protein [Cryobacterium sp. CG_9.6]
MRLSEFRRAVADEFGDAYGRVLTGDLVLGALDARTADAALESGIPARDVWLALCAETDVPAERRHGAGLPAARH